TVLLYTIDGRKSGHSIGASLAQVGARLVELGCVSAVCLDGGGSTNLAVTEPSETSATIWNVPSETGRRVSNHLFLVASAEGSGRLDRFYVKTSQDLVLAGSRVTVSARGVDTNHIPMDAAYDLSVSAGTLDGDTLVTPLAGGQITVTARGGGCSGETTVRAVETPERVTVRRNGSAVTSLTLAPASETALTATAEWEHRTLYADAELFTWSLEGDVGRLEDGKFIAETPGSGTLTVTAGGRSTAVPITVTAVPLKTLEDFEEGTLLSSDSVTAERVTSADQVRFGRASMRLDYEMTTGGAFLPIFIQTEAPYRDLNLWVRGDGSGNTLALLTQNGGETEIGTLDFTDWRVFNVRLPETPDTLTGLFIRGEAERGTIYLDQLTASYAGIVDEIAPSVEVQTEGRSVRAQIADATDGILNRSQIAVYCNGRAVEFFSYGTDGALTATFAEEDLPARVSVTARDASGNLARASVDLAAEETERLFTDTETHWAADYADFLYRAGITTGYEDGTFRPDRAVTRAQFAAMLCRYLGLETQEDAALPFADAEEIPAYARGSVAALYERGIVNGSEKNGALSFLPYSNLTRAQAAAMIGRTQEKGYALAEGAFADAASIPAYAELYVRTMVAQGVISGYADGTFRPANNITRGQMAKILYFLM
ncbi:MAG: S-layer homology domain-containing protein, partial [Oscillibacter sp.]|nr:S-layer homology domain-containing protein [Oscillibacter sp.]